LKKELQMYYLTLICLEGKEDIGLSTPEERRS